MHYAFYFISTQNAINRMVQSTSRNRKRKKKASSRASKAVGPSSSPRLAFLPFCTSFFHHHATHLCHMRQVQHVLCILFLLCLHPLPIHMHRQASKDKPAKDSPPLADRQIRQSPSLHFFYSTSTSTSTNEWRPNQPRQPAPGASQQPPDQEGACESVGGGRAIV